MVCSCGRMALATKAIGNTIKQMVRALSGMFMETNMWGNGSTTKRKVSAYTHMQMAPNIKVSGRRTYSMVRVLKNGLMEVATMENMTWDASMV